MEDRPILLMTGFLQTNWPLWLAGGARMQAAALFNQGRPEPETGCLSTPRRQLHHHVPIRLQQDSPDRARSARRFKLNRRNSP